ncbi:hypothetical protein VB735_24515 [Halotia wernerae UHCC 0503]|nr:hypothetical protein [Halotia wernerae UHCC 0503]
MDWLSSVDLPHLWNFVIAQTPTPSPVLTPAKNLNEIELLKSQLEFLKATNGQLGESFNRFVAAMQFTLVVFAFLGGVVVFVFGNNLKSAKEVATQTIQQEIDNHIAGLVRKEVRNVKRTLQRERVISSTTVDYYLPSLDGEPNEYKLLVAREFKNVNFWNKTTIPQRFLADVCVLDLENSIDVAGKKFSELPPDKRQETGKRIIDEFIQILPQTATLVIYVSPPHLNAINNATFKGRYYAPANTAISLVGMVADAAYVAHGQNN